MHAQSAIPRMPSPAVAPTYQPWLECLAGLRIRLELQEPAALPSEICKSPAFQTALRAWQERVRLGDAFDGPVLRPSRFQLGPRASLTIYARTYRYTEFQALSAYYLESGQSPRFLDEIRVPAPAISIAVGVVTSDGLVLVHRRSPRLGAWPGVCSLAFGEGLLPTDTGDLRRAAWRCLAEELGVFPTAETEASLRTLAVGQVTGPPSWVALSVLDARRLGPAWQGQALLARASTAKDSWEATDLQALPPGQLTGYLRENLHTPYSPTMARLLNGVLAAVE